MENWKGLLRRKELSNSCAGVVAGSAAAKRKSNAFWRPSSRLPGYPRASPHLSIGSQRARVVHLKLLALLGIGLAIAGNDSLHLDTQSHCGESGVWCVGMVSFGEVVLWKRPRTRITLWGGRGGQELMGGHQPCSRATPRQAPLSGQKLSTNSVRRETVQLSEVKHFASLQVHGAIPRPRGQRLHRHR